MSIWAHLRRPAVRDFTWLLASAVALVMVVGVIWNQSEANKHQDAADARAASFQTEIVTVSHQRDQALQEIGYLIRTSAANSERDAENIAILLRYVSELNRRDALLFRYLHGIHVAVPESLLQPIPVPKLVSTASVKTTKKAAKSHPKARK